MNPRIMEQMKKEKRSEEFSWMKERLRSELKNGIKGVVLREGEVEQQKRKMKTLFLSAVKEYKQWKILDIHWERTLMHTNEMQQTKPKNITGEWNETRYYRGVRNTEEKFVYDIG